MAEMITDKTMDEIEILAKLHLTEDEKDPGVGCDK